MMKSKININELIIFVLAILLLSIIAGCKKPEQAPKVQPVEPTGKKTPKVLVIEEDSTLAKHTAALIKDCLGYEIDTATATTIPADRNQYDVIFYYHNTYPDGLTLPAQGREPPFRNAWVEFGDPSAPNGVSVTRETVQYMIPILFDDAKLVYSVAIAAGDDDTADKIKNIPAYIKPEDFVTWCKGGFVTYTKLDFIPYKGDLPVPSYGAKGNWVDTLADCPDPFGIRPQYIEINGGWTPSQEPGEYTQQIKIPSNWKGATFVFRQPYSERSFDVSIGDQTFPTNYVRYWDPFMLGTFAGNETIKLSIRYSRENVPLIPETIPPIRFEAAPGSYPQEYLVYWDKNDQKLKVECNFINDTSLLTGGDLYCEIKNPTGEVVHYSTQVPAGSQHNVIAFPTSEYTPWKPSDPKFYRFHFLFQSKAGVDEYLATYGFNRLSSKDGYFRFEGESGYIRGAFQHAEALSIGSRGKAFFEGLKMKRFNAYFTDSVLLPAEIYAASEAGIFIGRIFRNAVWRQQQLYFVPGGDAPPGFVQAPAWLGKTSLPSGETGSGDIAYSTSKLIFNGQAGNSEKDWDILVVPECLPEYQQLTASLLKGEMPEWVNRSWRREAPLMLASPSVVCEDEPPVKPLMYELINLIRRQEWCAGFIIPLDSYTDALKGLMTDDFLIFDYEGLALDKPLTLQHGSVFHLPLRYANLKPTGDAGGAISWLWVETKEEGRVNYPEPSKKGIFEMPSLDIAVPPRPGKYTLHFEVMGANYFTQAVNWLDVVVE